MEWKCFAKMKYNLLEQLLAKIIGTNNLKKRADILMGSRARWNLGIRKHTN